MFENIGAKVKTLALVCFWLIVIGSVIGGISLMAVTTYGYHGSIEHPYVLAGILTIVGGMIFAWVSTAALYAIGEAADNSSRSVTQNDEIIRILNRAQYSSDLPISNSSTTQRFVWRCAKCQQDNPPSVSICQKCGEEKK